MTIEFFLLMLTVPLGALLTVGPAWVIEAWSSADLTAPRSLLPPGSAPSSVDDSTHHPSACLAVATERARHYLAVVATPWGADELDPLAWLLAGRVRDRFETALLAAIGAVRDWLLAGGHHADPRAQLERERISDALDAVIAMLPTFPDDLVLDPGCHYRVDELERVLGQLHSLSTSMVRHRRVVHLPPAAPYR